MIIPGTGNYQRVGLELGSSFCKDVNMYFKMCDFGHLKHVSTKCKEILSFVRDIQSADLNLLLGKTTSS